MNININKTSTVKHVLDQISITDSFKLQGQAYAPSNIALVKYWGKADTRLNIPNTDSLSISLGDLGANTKISILDKNINKDLVILNNQIINIHTDFYLRIKQYLDSFRCYEINNTKIFDYHYKIETSLNIPVAAGVASSACGFAALILAFADLFELNLNKKQLSILARLGSGSASRSLWDGFVYWQKGHESTGLDSFAYKYIYPEDKWSELCIGLIIISDKSKTISSRDAMLQTKETSVLYNSWPKQVDNDLILIKQAIAAGDLKLLGETAENNAMAMHATMLASKPPVCYYTSNTIEIMHKIWELRKAGTLVYFTQDAGPNLKLIFHYKDINKIKDIFKTNVQIVRPITN